MRLFSILILTLLVRGTSYCQVQENKLAGYVIGNKAHEKYVVYFNGRWLMTFEGEAYKVYFKVERLSHWVTSGYIKEFSIYRETKFGRKKLHFQVPYDEKKKYLIIVRDKKRSKRNAFVAIWSDEEPKLPD